MYVFIRFALVCCVLSSSTLAANVQTECYLDHWIEEIGVKSFNRNARIVNGEVVVPNSLPYQVALLTLVNSGQTSLCGGSLISSSKILTAAHCWWDGSSQGVLMQVVLGAHNLTADEPRSLRMNTTNVVIHPEYQPARARNDVAVVTLPEHVQFTADILAIALPVFTLANHNFFGQVAIISGWGRTGDGPDHDISSVLRHVPARVMAQFTCAYHFPNFVQDSNICTTGNGLVGACNGDSGGPVTINHMGRPVLIGVVSFGSAEGCELGLPSVHTRVTSFIQFIESNL